MKWMAFSCSLNGPAYINVIFFMPFFETTMLSLIHIARYSVNIPIAELAEDPGAIIRKWAHEANKYCRAATDKTYIGPEHVPLHKVRISMAAHGYSISMAGA